MHLLSSIGSMDGTRDGDRSKTGASEPSTSGSGLLGGT